jgi:hypothetical protein
MAHRWLENPWFAALLLTAIFSRALIPAGFMPGHGGLVICQGYAPARSSLATQGIDHEMSAMQMAGTDMSGMDMSKMGFAHQGGHPSKHGDSRDHEGSSLCPFAAAATTIASGHTAIHVAVVHTVVPRIDLPSQPFVPRGTIVPTRLPRGPPTVA